MADLTASQKAFVDRFAPYANLASQQTGLPSRVILAKLAIESNWGTQMFGNNIAGLKTSKAPAQNEYSIGSGMTRTFEDLAGGRTTLNDSFLRYASPEEGVGGFVSFLTNSGIPGMNRLVDRSGGGIFAPDAVADTAAINALNASPFSTDVNLVRTLPQRVSMIPDLSGYGVAQSFVPGINQHGTMAPYNNGAGYPDVGDGLGGFSSNDYRGGTEFQPGGGIVLPRERGADGLELPSPQMGGRQDGPGLLSFLAGGAGAVGRGLSDLFGGAGGGSGGLPSSLPAEGTDGFGSPGYGPGDLFGLGNGSLNNPGDLGYAGPFEPGNGTGFTGANVSGGVGNGTFANFGNPFGLSPPTRGPGDALGAGPGTLGQLPAGFDAASYLAANRDVAASGMDAATHWRNFGAQEGRSLGAPGLTPTLGPSGSTEVVPPSWTVWRLS